MLAKLVHTGNETKFIFTTIGVHHGVLHIYTHNIKHQYDFCLG